MPMRPFRRKQAEAPFVYDASATGSFRALGEISHTDSARTATPLRAVVVGGGTGAPVSIRTLVNLGASTSAVVAMADDGGSTGILRNEAGVMPPGDVRKCLSAFAQDADDALVRAFRSRFSFADNHTLGNLMLSALEDVTGSFPEAIRICESLLHAQGQVLPSTLTPVRLVARVCDGRRIEGQAFASHSAAALHRVTLEADETIAAYPPAIEVLHNADLIVLGPGSLFTSIIPNLLVPGIGDAVLASKATVVFVCSLADIQGETSGMSARDHYGALCAHGMAGRIDYMLVNRVSQDMSQSSGLDVPLVRISDEDLSSIAKRGTQLIVRDFVDRDHPTWHNAQALHQALGEVLEACRLRRR